MDLSLFATQTTKTTAQPVTGSNNALLGNAGLNALNGIDNAAFWNAILGNLAQDGAGEQNNDVLAGKTGDTATSETVKKETVDLALLQLGILGQDPDKSLEEKLSELKLEQLTQTENNRVEQLTKLIDHLTSGLPQAGLDTNASIEDLVTRLSQRLENLEASLDAFRTGDFNDDDAPFQLLIATGLNPAEFTNITSRIEAVESKLGRKLTVEDLIAGVGNIIPVPNTKEAEELSSPDALTFLLRGLQENSNKTAEIVEHKADKDYANKKQDNIDALALINATPNLSLQENVAKALGLTPTNGSTSGDIDGELSDLPENISNAEFRSLFGARDITGDINSNFKSKNQIANISFADKMQTVVPSALAGSGSFNPALSFNDSLFSSSALSEALGFDVQTGAPFTQTMQAAHAITTSQSASQTHQASNMVAAQMTKAVKTGDTRQITLQLDPAELGRVEVRMEFGSDKKVTAHIIAERPETYLMLQRDQATLERALQNLGLETDGDSFNFQLAEDDYGFGSENNDRNNKSGTQNARDNNEDDGIQVIETNIDWNIDPLTGHVRYNIMA